VFARSFSLPMRTFIVLATALVSTDGESALQPEAVPGVVLRTKQIAGVDVHMAKSQESMGEAESDPILSWILRLDPASSDSDVSGVSAKVQAAGADHTLEGHPSEGGLSIVVAKARESQLEAVLTEVGRTVRYVEQDVAVYAMKEDFPSSWGLDRIDDRSGLDGSYLGSGESGGAGVHVYVVDTGIRTTHEDFEGRAIPTLESLGRGVELCDSSDTSCANDWNGHGTHCAGTVGGRTYGVAKKAILHAVKVIGPFGEGRVSDLLLAMDWLAANGERPGVVSMSLGVDAVLQSVGDAVDAMVSSGLVVVVGAGNSNADACSFSPAYAPNAITVGATDISDFRADYSNYGACLDIFAPGSSIMSASNASDRASRSESGTSMACPHVAGAAALLLGRDPSATPADIRENLLDASTSNHVSNVGVGSPNLLLFTSIAATSISTTTASTTTTSPTTTSMTTTTSTITMTTSTTTTSTTTTSTTTTSTTTTTTTTTTTAEDEVSGANARGGFMSCKARFCEFLCAFLWSAVLIMHAGAMIDLH